MPAPQKQRNPSGRLAGFEADEEEADSYYSFADRVLDRLTDRGVVVRQRPKIMKDHESIFDGLEAGEFFDGRLPAVISKLDLNKLSALYSLFSNWYAYIQYQTHIIAAERSEAKHKKEFTWSMVRTMYRIDPETEKKRTDQIISDMARNDIRFIQANARYEELNALYACMTAMVEVAKADMAVISREVTIQQMAYERKVGASKTYGRMGNVEEPSVKDRFPRMRNGNAEDEDKEVPKKASSGRKRFIRRG